MICTRCNEARAPQSFKTGVAICNGCAEGKGRTTTPTLGSAARTVINGVDAVNCVENISDRRAFYQYPGEMRMVMTSVAEAMETVMKKPKADIECIFDWLEDWDWVAESDPGRAWSFDWCVEMLSVTRSEYDAGKLRVNIQKAAFSYDYVCGMRDKAVTVRILLIFTR